MISHFLPIPLVQAARTILGTKAHSHARFRRFVEDKIGLEIGGPSEAFSDRGTLPLYLYASQINNCVYASQTMWEGQREEGWTFRYHPRKSCGFNFIREATDLHGIANASYNFVLSCHSLEHTANPIKALKEWKRVTRPGGGLIVLVPHYKYTFDRRRCPTPVHHMLEDYERGTKEDDETHIQEILELHDLSLHPQRITYEQLRTGIVDNFMNRFAHHHVFDENNVSQLLDACGFHVIHIQVVKPHHIVLLAVKPD